MPKANLTDFTDEQFNAFQKAAELGSGVEVTDNGNTYTVGGANPIGYRATSINSTAIAPTTTANYSYPKENPIYPVGGLNSELTLTAPEKKESDLRSMISDLNNSLVGESQMRAEQEKIQGIDALTKTQNDLSSRLKAVQNEALAIPLQLQQDATGRGITAGGLRPHQAAALRTNAIQALTVSSALEASRGNLTTALDLVDRAVAQKFDPIKERHAAATKNLEQIINSPEYSLADKNRAIKAKAIQDAKAKSIEKEEQDDKDIKEIILAASANQADALTIDAISRASTPLEAIQIFAKSGFATSPETQIIQLDNGNTMLVNKKTGEVIKSYGGAKSAESTEGYPQLYGGLSSATATAVRAKVGKFGTEPVVQNFATIQEGKNFVDSLSNTTTNPADDQGLIYALAKALDPGSVVREGEYATAQKYSQSWITAYGKGVTQAIAGTGFLSEQARKNIKSIINSKYQSSKQSYDSLYNQYATGVNTITGRANGKDFLVDYSVSQKYQPGEIIHNAGVMYKVEDDGETITPIGSSAL